LELIVDYLAAAGETVIDQLQRRKKAMNATELSDMLGLSGKHLLKMAKLQRIPNYRIGGSVRFDPGAVALWLEQRTIGC
jgi:excisionase family DNA binding protein